MIAKKSAFALAAIACAATVMPSMASAQIFAPSYSQTQDQAYYDPCLREQRERQATSGVVGAAIGALAGSQVASRKNRTEGSLIGGVLGAAIGANVGRGTAACTPGEVAPAQPVYYETRPAAPVYDRRDYRRDEAYDYYRDYPQGYERGAPQPAPAPVDDGCRLAESEIRLPDGRVEIRHVRTCPDKNGRYRVVD